MTNGNGEVKRGQRLSNARLVQAEYARNLYVATLEAGTLRSVLEDESFWSHVGNKLKAWDRIEVRCEDFSWMAECVVRASGINFAQVEMLWFKELGAVTKSTVEAAEEASKPQYSVQWKGPQNRFCVVRAKDKRIMKKELASAEAGQAWVTSHLKALER